MRYISDLKKKVQGKFTALRFPKPLDTPPVELSVVINTLNEEKNIKACIESVRSFASEIIVVDMESDDSTVEIARSCGAKVFSHARVGYVEPARNFAISHATGNWILILDADERLRLSLGTTVSDLIAVHPGFGVFKLFRRNEIFGRWMQSSGWGDDWQLRLFRKGSIVWRDVIHSQPEINDFVCELDDSVVWLDHYNYTSVSAFVTRLNNYTTHEASTLALRPRGIQTSVQAMLRSVVNEFTQRYDVKNDGLHSFLLTGLMMFYRWTEWSKYFIENGIVPEDLPESADDLLKQLSDALKFIESNAVRLEGDRRDILPDGLKIDWFGFWPKEQDYRWLKKRGVIKPLGSVKSLSFDVIQADQPVDGLNELSIFSNGIRVAGIRTGGSQPQRVRVDLSEFGNEQPIEIGLYALTTWRPSDFGSTDSRELSYMVRLVDVQRD